MLSDQRQRNLEQRVAGLLESHPFRPPRTDESEPQFTAQVVAPAVAEMFADLGVRNITMRGDGSLERAIHASVYGHEFYPDIGLSYHRQLVLAVEVKFLREGGVQNALATALGQAALYLTRYSYSIAFLVASKPASDSAIESLRSVGAASRIRPVVRCLR